MRKKEYFTQSYNKKSSLKTGNRRKKGRTKRIIQFKRCGQNKE